MKIFKKNRKPAISPDALSQAKAPLNAYDIYFVNIDMPLIEKRFSFDLDEVEEIRFSYLNDFHPSDDPEYCYSYSTPVPAFVFELSNGSIYSYEAAQASITFF